MKITYNTTGFLSEGVYYDALKSFLQQYDGRFPGVEYLHLDLNDMNTEQVKLKSGDRVYYSSNGKMLKIRVVISNADSKSMPFEVYNDLRDLFDSAVEEHLKNHQQYLRYTPEL